MRSRDVNKVAVRTLVASLATFSISGCTNREYPLALVGTWLPDGALSGNGLNLRADGSGYVTSKEMLTKYRQYSGPPIRWYADSREITLRIADEEGKLSSSRTASYTLRGATLQVGDLGMIYRGLYSRYPGDAATEILPTQ